jgi:hypothetical protein
MFARSHLLSISVLVLGCSGSGVGTTDETASATGTPTTAASGEEGGEEGGEAGGETGDDGNDSGNDSDPTNDDGNDSAETNAESGPSEESGGEESGGEESGGEPVDLEGAWLSEGDNIAPVFLDPSAPAQLTRVEASFDGTSYTVYADTVQGDSFTLSGTYVVDDCADGSTKHIMLEQTGPVPASFEGIYAIDSASAPAVMQYEVSQTGGIGFEPGLVPPTCDGGFGSSQPAGADNIQIYERMP